MQESEEGGEMKKNYIGLMLFTLFCASLSSYAAPESPIEPDFSRGLQQAKRVAVLENSDSLPSRGYLLSARCIQNAQKNWQAVNTAKRTKKNIKNLLKCP